MTDQRLDFVSAGRNASGVRGRLAHWHRRLRARRKTWMAIRGFREIVLIVGTYSLYDVTRFLVAGDHDGAISHGRAIFNFEQRWNIAPEHWLNKAISPHVLLAVPSDYIYATLHYVVTPIVLIWLWRRHPPFYGGARNVLLFTTLIGLACFSLYPVAPPRLLGGFIDTMAKYSHYGWWGKAASAPRGFGHDTNQYAAMPSLHVGWALWSGWQLVKHGKHRVTRWLGVLYPIVLSIVVVATANHYLLDVVGGVAAVLLGTVMAWLFGRIGWSKLLPVATEHPPPSSTT
ncbi:MAG TPA: phosphatase PAP2 family protein [Mycobacteriales bacterium]|nr:phosphatase PAP2 family protein [Mycobacteriales bacterium]